MPISSKLLKRAYQLAESGDFENVARLLEMVLQKDPKNIEAWEYYLQICTCAEDLDWLADRVQANQVLSEDQKVDILQYYNYRRDKLEIPTVRQLRIHDTTAEEKLIIPSDIHNFERFESMQHGVRKPRFSLISSKNVVPLTLILLLATYILDKTIPNNGLIGFFIVLALSFLYIYWLTTAGIFNLPSPRSRSFAKDIRRLEELEDEDDEYLDFYES
jgi:hypothetical protein